VLNRDVHAPAMLDAAQVSADEEPAAHHIMTYRLRHRRRCIDSTTHTFRGLYDTVSRAWAFRERRCHRGLAPENARWGSTGSIRTVP
jgi:hypothetical protein